MRLAFRTAWPPGARRRSARSRSLFARDADRGRPPGPERRAAAGSSLGVGGCSCWCAAGCGVRDEIGAWWQRSRWSRPMPKSRGRRADPCSWPTAPPRPTPTSSPWSRSTCTVPAGQAVALVGHNGSGKSTFLRLAAGLLDLTEATITVAGEPAGTSDARAAVSFLPDEPVLYDDLSVREHLAYVAALHGVTVDGDDLDELLDRVGLAPPRRRPAGPVQPRACARRRRSRSGLVRPVRAAARRRAVRRPRRAGQGGAARHPRRAPRRRRRDRGRHPRPGVRGAGRPLRRPARRRGRPRRPGHAGRRPPPRRRVDRAVPRQPLA